MADADKATNDAIYHLLTCGVPPGAADYGAGALGVRVTRAAAADPQNVWVAIFTITGVIAVTSLTGIRTVIQAGGASNMQFRHTVGPTNICAAAAITGNAVGTFYLITGDFTDPVQVGAAGIPLMFGKVVATSTTYGCLPLFICGAGDIEVTCTAGAGTGSTGYSLTYIPLLETSTVVAA